MEEVLDELGVIEGKRSDVNKVLTYEILKINKQTDTHLTPPDVIINWQ